jgi:hypothetical protein
VDYLGRHGELALETDDGESISGKAASRELLENWDLDIDEHRRQSTLLGSNGRAPPKLVHKLLFSMPPGTPSQAVLAAAKIFLREEFALKHRYAFVLHTDEPHPHVHAVVKAVSEQGVRLKIKKATLREWRAEFARHLRDQGIEANATERAVRGETRSPQKDAIYRAERRGASTYMREHVQAVATELSRGTPVPEPGKATLLATRQQVEAGWTAINENLTRLGHSALAQQVQRFADQMPSAVTAREMLARRLIERGHELRSIEVESRTR